MNIITHLDKIFDESTGRKKQTLELLLEAINDWPESWLLLEDFLIAVEKKIKGEISIINVESKLNEINVASEAWIGESLTSIREIMLLNNNQGLRKILKDLN